MDLYGFTEGIVTWLVGIVNYLLNWLGAHGLAVWLGSPDVIRFLTITAEVIVVFLVGFLIAITMIWQERKTLGRLMDRRGAMVVGPAGYFQNIADGLKTFLKEIIVPRSAERTVYNWAVVIMIASSLFLLAAIPLSDRFYLSDLDGGLLFIFAIFSITPFAILLGGWASNNKYSLIGGMRSAAQLISYEVPLLLSMVGVVLLSGSLNIGDIVSAQQQSIWYIVPQFIGFVVFLIAIVAEVERIPFDLPEAEAELVEGWWTEYGGMRFGLAMLAEYFRGYAGAAVAVILFLGGWSGPVLPPEIWFLIKVFIVFFIIIWIRGSLTRVRVDQILNIGWKRLLPLSMVNLAVAVAVKTMGW
ncbi:MAG: NADH-quinone oxidoreductase subunit NuoH, partial [Euryarchaeota archaeon]|nr:NADH-quinone oxidoreductase subunit NuoH [Euryarchaeota archaeon]